MTEGFQDHYAEVNGVKLHYVTAGNGKGKPVMFVHGFPEFWYAWRKQLEEFGSEYQVVAPDMRGYNLSEKPEGVEQYQRKLLVDDLLGLADHLGWDKFILVAHDWGGIIAWWLAIDHSERLEKLVIINAPHLAVYHRELLNNPAQQKASQYTVLFRSPKAEQVISANNYTTFFDTVFRQVVKEHFSEEDRQAYLNAWAQSGGMTGPLNYYRASKIGPATGDPTEFIAKPLTGDHSVRVPTLVIWGEQDEALLTGNLDGLEQYVPNLTVKRIPEGTHWVVHEFPEKVNQYIREFIA